MAKDKNKVAVDRRGFLKTLGAGAAGAGATGVVAITPAAAAESERDKRKARYRETEHVKAFYRTNRY